MLNRSHPCWTPQQVGYLAHRLASAQQEWKLRPLASGAARKRHEESTLRYIPEPFKIKMVEPIKMTTREEREGFIRSANYNAFFIKEREAAYKDVSPIDITREMFSYADVFTMSAKKDALVNMGGLLGVREDGALVEAIKTCVISFEGYLTYGGLSGRDLEALATGLYEGLDHDFLRYRVGQMQYLAARLTEYGIPFQNPVGGHAVFVDAGKMLPHIPFDEFPGQALTIELYIEAGIRACDIGSFLMDRDPETGEQLQAPFEFTRLAVPRRVYTQAHLDVVADALRAVMDRAEDVKGYLITWEPKVLRHFTSHLKPVG